MSTNCTAVVYLLAGEPLRRREPRVLLLDALDQVVLLAAEPVAVGLLLDQALQVFPNQGRHSGATLSGPDPRLEIEVVGHSNCDVLHSFSVAWCQRFTPAAQEALLILFASRDRCLGSCGVPTTSDQPVE